MQSTIPKPFNPSINHPNYIIRKGLLNGIKKFAPTLQGKLLDFGCGTKPYVSLFPQVEYIGVDYLAEGVSPEGKVADFFYNGTTLPFADNTFDAVLSSEVFEHVFNLEPMIQELRRVMKPGAKILITCPFAYCEHEVPHDFARYTSFAIQDLMQRNGFNILHYEKAGNSVETITQLINTYYHLEVVSKVEKIPFVRTLFREVGYTAINVVGLLMSALLPNSKTLYLNNILLAEKN